MTKLNLKYYYSSLWCHMILNKSLLYAELLRNRWNRCRWKHLCWLILSLKPWFSVFWKWINSLKEQYLSKIISNTNLTLQMYLLSLLINCMHPCWIKKYYLKCIYWPQTFEHLCIFRKRRNMHEASTCKKQNEKTPLKEKDESLKLVKLEDKAGRLLHFSIPESNIKISIIRTINYLAKWQMCILVRWSVLWWPFLKHWTGRFDLC